MIQFLLIVLSLNANGAGTITVTPHESFESCETATPHDAPGVSGCYGAPGGNVDEEHPIVIILAVNHCTMGYNDATRAVWTCTGRTK